ncbi:hypothetical protein EXIGLDRAFT_768183 [Exidia glandulosa HHB12029]|uniref:Uncharacterized protein n=1 Tax=Exidia glandulosa HHB12029 TaxID=1314781 RepID=A0A165IEB4_EXIGL|nr:hypothetical protein EXIGLDRAFT_768183 [Exidia glandulosa HHB12029]
MHAHAQAQRADSHCPPHAERTVPGRRSLVLALVFALAPAPTPAPAPADVHAHAAVVFAQTHMSRADRLLTSRVPPRRLPTSRRCPRAHPAPAPSFRACCRCTTTRSASSPTHYVSEAYSCMCPCLVFADYNHPSTSVVFPGRTPMHPQRPAHSASRVQRCIPAPCTALIRPRVGEGTLELARTLPACPCPAVPPMFYSTYHCDSNGEIIDPSLLPAPAQAHKSLYYCTPSILERGWELSKGHQVYVVHSFCLCTRNGSLLSLYVLR